jgi:hypothetical protein
MGGAALMVSGAAAAPALSSEHQFTEHLNRAQLVYRVHRGTPHHRIAWVRRWVWDDFWGDYHIVWVPRVTTYRTVSYTPSSHRTRKVTMSDGSGDDDSATKSAGSKEARAAQPDKDTTASVKPEPRPQPTAKTASNDTKLPSIDTDAKPAQTAAKPAPSANNNTKLAALDKHPKPTQTAEKPAAKVTADLTKPVTPAEIRSAVPLGKVDDPKQTLTSAPIKSVWGDAIGKVRGVDVSGGNLKTVDAALDGKGVVKMDPAHLKYVKSRGLLITTLSKEDAAKLPKADNL